MSTRALLLDVMDTVVHDPYREIPSFFGMDLVELWGATDRSAWVEFELGHIDNDAFLDRFFTDRRAFDRAGFLDLFRRGYRWMPGMEALVRELGGAGVELHALSNYPSWTALVDEALGMGELLPWTFVSWRTGVRKPDPGAYLGAAEALGLPPADCLFVDDREKNVAAARAVGMQALRFEGAEGLRAALVERGILAP